MIGKEQVKPTQIKPSSNWKQFNDDQPLDFKNAIMNPDALQNYLLSSNFKLTMTPHQDRYKLPTPTDIPILVSLQSEELFKEEGQTMHVNMDIVCVVDHSGSMEGLKIKYLRQTLQYLVEQLRDNDRFSLVMFDDKAVRLTPLLRMSPENKIITNKAIDSVKPDGGTDINLGMQFALQVLAQRRQQNVITTIMLLTDGLDDGAIMDIEKSLKSFEARIPQNFTINTFGYGKDHDPLLMARIAELRNGKFYFVENLEEISLCFFDCLGGLLSTIGENVEIEITINDEPHCLGKSIGIMKAFGKSSISMDQKQCRIQIGQVLAGTSKDYIIILQVPPVNKILQDHEKGVVLCKARCTMNQVKNQANEEQKLQEKIVLNADVSITVLNQNEEQKDFEVDEIVEYHYIRFLASEQLQKAQLFAENNQFQEGSEAIDNIINRINFQTIKKPNEAMQILQEDLLAARQLMAPQMYNQNAGRHQIQQTISSQMNQFTLPRSRNYEQCSNKMQQNMVTLATYKISKK